MFLVLEVTSANASSLGAAARMVFSRQGGSIGRRAGNDWVLPDAHVSGRHARVRAMGGTFFLEDNESGNGVIVNGNRIHAGEPFPLKDGDVVFIDPFEISARLSATMPDALSEVPAAVGQVPPVVAPMPSPAAIPPPAPAGGLDDLIGAGAGGADEFNALLDTPPATPALAIPSGLDLLAKPVLHDSLNLATPSMPPAMTPAAPAQRAGGGIPMNWDLSDLEPNAPARVVPPLPSRQIPSITQVMAPAAPVSVPPVAPAFVPAAPPVVSPVAAVVPPAVPAVAVSAGGTSSDLLEVLRGAGLDVNSIDPQVAAQLGQVLRTVVEGLMEVLRARGEIKGEFRLQQTTFKPRENNPLKFSANVEDALHNLLVKRNAAYLNAPAAFEDAFADVRSHQVAMLAGMRAAFDYMLTRFDPAALAAQFDARPGRKLSLGIGAGGRHWDSFGEYYKEMTRDRDDCFRRLFGDQFARAYEEQLQRLRAESNKSP
jgi:type VI secretion system FHA domain protein